MNILVPTLWLKDYLKTDVAAKTLANSLSLCGPSVERMEKHGQDLVFDVEVTTNRPDTYSIYGLAREAHAILQNENQKSTLVAPKGLNAQLLPDTQQHLKLEVKIADQTLCPRFTAIIMEDVKIKPSPAAVKNRLEAAGIRSINNIVDISNFVMLELGQPMHMFDYDKIKGAKMLMRESKKGESIKTLDGQNRKLPEGSIVIQDAERLIDLCGIMGGENSQISSRTKRVVLFVQAYDPIKIRKTTQALAFRTDAASRFEKGVDIAAIHEALSRAVFLTKEMAGGKIASELIDIHKGLPKSRLLTLDSRKLTDYLGIDFPTAKASKILTSLGFECSTTDDKITAAAPTWRTQDMESDVDLIEEIARIYGYHNLPSQLPRGEVPKTGQSDLGQVISLKSALKYLGLTEIISYSIISEQFLGLTGVKKEDAVELANPLSDLWQYMRPTLLISLADAIANNQNLKPGLQIFEVAKTYIKDGTNLPIQDLHLTIALQGDFSKIKGLAENVFEILNREVEFKKGGSGLYEPNLSAQVISNGKIVGTLGILNSQISDHFGLSSQVAACELNLSGIYSLPPVIHTYRPVAKYPPLIEDVSAIFEASIPVAQIITEIKKAGSPLVKKVEILDIYQDEKMGESNKSVTLRLYYQLAEATPNSEDVAPVRQKVFSSLQTQLSAKIRK